MECVERQTEHAERQTKQAEQQTEHAKDQIEQAKRQTEHSARQTEQAERQTKHAARQTEHAARQIEHVKWHTNWHTDFQPFIHKQVDEHTLTHADWPNNLIKIIKKVIKVPCNTPIAPEFIFKLSQTMASHNLDVLSKYQNDLSKALEANKSSPLGYGSEFRHPDKLRKIFGLHPLWPRMKQILIKGSKWSLDKLSEESGQKDFINALAFGNHKGASAKPELLRHLISKDVKYGYSLPIPLSWVKSIPGLLMAPMNIMMQNMINEIGQIIPKRSTHPQSKLEMELGNVRQQQSQKRTSSGMPFWILHSSNHQLGSRRTKQLPKFPHPRNQDRLQVRILARPSQSWNCPPNLHTTPRWRNGYRDFSEHIRQSTVPLRVGHQIWDDLQFSKWIDS